MSEGIVVGYSRVSTLPQDIEAQRDALLALGVPPERIYLDHGFSGKSLERDGFKQALAALRGDGDRFVVPRMDRFARNAEETLELVRKLTDDGVIFQMGHTVYNPRDPLSKLFLTFLAAVAEAEGGWISLRTREAMARPEVRKKLKGRKPSIPPADDALIARLMAERERSAASIAASLKISRSGVYRAVARHEARTKSAEGKPPGGASNG